MNIRPKANIRDMLDCEIIEAGSPGYDEARALYNAMLDKRPRWIAKCRHADDVAAAVKFARHNNILLAVCGGRHNGAGLGSCDGGLVADLSLMNKIEVDAEARTVRVGPGCTQGGLPTATLRRTKQRTIRKTTNGFPSRDGLGFSWSVLDGLRTLSMRRRLRGRATFAWSRRSIPE